MTSGSASLSYLTGSISEEGQEVQRRGKPNIRHWPEGQNMQIEIVYYQEKSLNFQKSFKKLFILYIFKFYYDMLP